MQYMIFMYCMAFIWIWIEKKTISRNPQNLRFAVPYTPVSLQFGFGRRHVFQAVGTEEGIHLKIRSHITQLKAIQEELFQ